MGDPEGRPPPTRKERARDFVFEDQGDRDRFGILDPAVRWTYLIGTGTVAGLAAGTLVETFGGGAGTVAAALVTAALVVAGGVWGYRKIWVPPVERELLLQMAKEDDEARAMAARLAAQRRQE
jgi:hypothetical protein